MGGALLAPPIFLSQDFAARMDNSIFSMISIYDCEIIEQTEITPGTYRTRLACPDIARDAVAGQFVNVQVSKTTDPLLRRPFSIHATDPANGVFSLLYVVVGRGTELLRHIPAGQKISVVGPLGRGFDLGDVAAEHIVVAGGCGAAPLHFLCDALCAKWGCESITVLTGGRSKDAILCEAEFRAHGVEVGVSTDDASYGFGGYVTQMLEERLKSPRAVEKNLPVRVYSCGPQLMMKEVARICREAGVSNCQVSLENNMACGLGVCMGCVQKIKGRNPACDAQGDASQSDVWHYERVCKDGPVFNAEDVLWE